MFGFVGRIWKELSAFLIWRKRSFSDQKLSFLEHYNKAIHNKIGCIISLQAILILVN